MSFQFAGLVFNKAADSCDYPRNVICPKAKTSIVSTTRSPITAATSRTTYLHSTTTPKAKAEEEEEEEYDSEEEYDDDEIEESEEEEVKEKSKTITTAKPLVYKTLTRSRPSTTTTTTSKPSETERTVYTEDEEDPRVIKELIDLIKKAGKYTFPYLLVIFFILIFIFISRESPRLLGYFYKMHFTSKLLQSKIKLL